MNSCFQPTILQHGFIAFHGNRAEDLAEVVIQWLRRHPLSPLQEEVILVQSNGMAEWVKMTLARHAGVCAATRVELPSRFLWRTYRQVLGRDAVPAASPLDKLPMVWRLMQLLPELLAQACFAPVAGFLKADEPDRMLQLATQLADLLDQYQNYRADWLQAWAQGQDVLINAHGGRDALAPEQQWQAGLWRALLQTLTAQQQLGTRPQLHQRVLDRLASAQAPATPVAQRVIVFGMSQIPWTTLQALAALAAHSQVLLAVPNPCRFYWGDIMEGRELLQAQHRRQPWRHGRDLSALPLQDMHAHAQPLLAAWGRQGRDLIRLLDAFDNAEQCRRRFDLARIDVFDETPETPQTPLLRQVQNRIRDLLPLAEHPACSVADSDRSIVFHCAHSPMRELEILHDQLLQWLAAPAGPPGASAALAPRDVIVMVPDIEPMAPAIRAVFGQYKRQDARFIPFDIADMSARASSPLIGAIDWLLRLPQQRCGLSELVDLLEVGALARRFGVAPAALPQLTQWMAGAGIRWGLDLTHRNELGLQACGDQNSAWFGLRRMLLGYASGMAVVPDPLPALATVEPYGEVGGLQAGLAGSLAHLLQALVHWCRQASTSATPQEWVQRCQCLLTAMLQAESDTDRQALKTLQEGLTSWQQACADAGFVQAVPLVVARTGWMQALDVPRLNQRFQAGGVTFCTLMPMRAIPFEVVCLLGMNDGDYPRRSTQNDFDLMKLPGNFRPGDRSRRSDDRQLMLEALLSARRQLYVSWCGRSVRDNSEQAPSVLVAQLRDYLSAGWGAQVVADRSTQHPLQPFSRRYFEQGSPLQTFAREWRTVHNTPAQAPAATPEPPALAAFQADPRLPVTVTQLTRFLRNPVQAFFRQRLQVVFAQEQQDTPDDECFAVDGLHEYTLMQQLLQDVGEHADPAHRQASLSTALLRLRKGGELPMQGLGELQQHHLQEVLLTMLQAWQTEQARFPDPAERQSVHLQQGEVVLQDWVDHLRQGHLAASANTPADASAPAQTRTAWLQLQPDRLLGKGSHPVARPDKLLGAWVRSLALAASGVAVHGVLVGRDGVLDITPMPQDEARNTLGLLLALWLQGMNEPLPLPPKTALAQLTGQNPAAQYDGGYQQAGEVQEPCLARMFADYAALSADGRFQTLAQHIYGPLLQWAEQHVSARTHPTGGTS